MFYSSLYTQCSRTVSGTQQAFNTWWANETELSQETGKTLFNAGLFRILTKYVHFWNNLKKKKSGRQVGMTMASRVASTQAGPAELTQDGAMWRLTAHETAQLHGASSRPVQTPVRMLPGTSVKSPQAWAAEFLESSSKDWADVYHLRSERAESVESLFTWEPIKEYLHLILSVPQ